MRKYTVGSLYLEGSVLKVARHGDDLLLEVDVTPDEAAEVAAEVGMGVRIFTGVRRQRRQSSTGWPKG